MSVLIETSSMVCSDWSHCIPDRLWIGNEIAGLCSTSDDNEKSGQQWTS